MRIVLDTNIMVSSLLAPSGNQSRVLNFAFNRSFELLVSEDIFTEYDTVLHRAELKLPPEQVERILVEIRRLGVLVEPTETLSISPHEPDNRFLECAAAGDADYLVTGNKRHFPLRFGKTAVINTRQFLELISPEAGRQIKT